MAENKEEKIKEKQFKQFYSLVDHKMEDFSVFDLENDLEILKPEVQKTSKQQKHCGSVENYDRYLDNYINSNSEFMTVSYGITRKIMYGKRSFIFNGLKGEKKPLGTHLISIVRRDIDKLIEELKLKGLDVPKIPQKKNHLTFVHNRNLQFYGSGVEALAIDINHCHWRTAFLLKSITELSYKKGLEKDEYKDGRLIAIGTLGKVLTVTKYRPCKITGKSVKHDEYIDDRDYLKYGGFYWSIIDKVYALMIDLWANLKEDFLMFLTDCVVIDPSKKDLAISIIEKHGYSCKEYSLVFTDMNDYKISWVTQKGENKHIINNEALNRNSK